MNMLENISETLGTTNPWVERGGAQWLVPGSVSVREIAKAMNSIEARFITITAYQLPGDEGLRLEYHWDNDGQLLGFTFLPVNNAIESIYDLCEAADWIEREVHEGFNLDFTGRPYEPLLLRKGDKMGINMREEGK